MNKREKCLFHALAALCCVLILIGLMAGCSDDDTYVAESEKNQAEPAQTGCENLTLTRIECTYRRLDSDGTWDPAPKKVSGRIYEYCLAAIRQCHDYQTINQVYYDSMKLINSGEDALDVESWAKYAIGEITGFEPTIECPGGCA